MNIQQYPHIPIHYAGGYSEVLQWYDIPSGITDKRYWGLEFVQGTNIILSRFAVDNLVADYINKSDIIDLNIVDDVSIALYFARNHQKFKSLMHNTLSQQNKSLISTPWNIIIKLPGFVFINKNNMNYDILYDEKTEYWGYRHKTSTINREIDYLLMNNTIEKMKKNI